jgi:integrase
MRAPIALVSPLSPTLVDQNLSPKLEKCYDARTGTIDVYWNRRFIRFCFQKISQAPYDADLSAISDDLESGIDIRTVQSLLGHTSVETTMIYLHIMKRPGAGAPSPLDLD